MPEKTKELDLLTIPAGFTIKCEGVPFVLEQDTLVRGHRGNMVWLREQEIPKLGAAPNEG